MKKLRLGNFGRTFFSVATLFCAMTLFNMMMVNQNTTYAQQHDAPIDCSTRSAIVTEHLVATLLVALDHAKAKIKQEQNRLMNHFVEGGSDQTKPNVQQQLITLKHTESNLDRIRNNLMPYKGVIDLAATGVKIFAVLWLLKLTEPLKNLWVHVLAKIHPTQNDALKIENFKKEWASRKAIYHQLQKVEHEIEKESQHLTGLEADSSNTDEFEYKKLKLKIEEKRNQLRTLTEQKQKIKVDLEARVKAIQKSFLLTQHETSKLLLAEHEIKKTRVALTKAYYSLSQTTKANEIAVLNDSITQLRNKLAHHRSVKNKIFEAAQLTAKTSRLKNTIKNSGKLGVIAGAAGLGYWAYEALQSSEESSSSLTTAKLDRLHKINFLQLLPGLKQGDELCDLYQTDRDAILEYERAAVVAVTAEALSQFRVR